MVGANVKIKVRFLLAKCNSCNYQNDVNKLKIYQNMLAIKMVIYFSIASDGSISGKCCNWTADNPESMS